MKYLVMIVLFQPTLSWGLVNPVDLSISENARESVDPDLSLFRHYHSSRKEIGLLGRGWCSPLESTLKLLENSATFIYCGSGKRVDFFKRGRQWLSENNSYRLNVVEDQITVLVSQTPTYVFSKKNLRLLQLRQGQQVIKLEYKYARLVRMIVGEKTYSLSYKGSRLFKVFNGEKLQVEYQVNNDHLTRVWSNGSQPVIYDYNKQGLLTSISTSEVSKKYYYKGLTPWKVSLGQCEEIIQKYSLGQSKQKVKVTKKCHANKPEVTEFTISGNNRNSGLVVMKAIGGIQSSMEWKNGRLVKKKNPSGSQSYYYDQFGQLRSVASSNGAKIYVRDRLKGRPSRVSLTNGSKGKGSIENIQLKWKNSRLVEMRGSNWVLKINPSKKVVQLIGKDISAQVIQRRGTSVISGRYKGKKISSFHTTKPLESLNEAEFGLLMELSGMISMSERIELI